MRKGTSIILLLVLVGCIDNFDLPRGNQLPTLVVEGRISDQSGPYFVRLSSTKQLVGDTIPSPETGANVIIEEADGPAVTLVETEPGLYSMSSNDLQGQAGEMYRLIIRLPDGRNYQSPWELLRPTPEILDISLDFVTKASKNGLQLFLSTEDETGQASYFRWEVEETWQYKVPYATRLVYAQAELKPEEDFHETCWITRSKKDIMLTTVNDQSERSVINHPLAFIPSDSARLNIRYSALVRQYAVGLEEFSFWKGLKATNEDVGGLFDNQPYQVVSNVSNVADENELVFGYFSANSVTEKRIYINREDFPEDFLPAKTFSDCPLLDLSTATPEVHFFYLSNGIYVYVFGANFTLPYCGDCEEYGGTTVKPTFWEE